MGNSAKTHADYQYLGEVPKLETARNLQQEYTRCRTNLINSAEFHPQKKPENYALLERVDAILTDIVIDSVSQVRCGRAFSSDTYNQIKKELAAVRHELEGMRGQWLLESLMPAYLIAENIVNVVASESELASVYTSLNGEYQQRAKAFKEERAKRAYPLAMPMYNRDAEVLAEIGKFLEGCEQSCQNGVVISPATRMSFCNTFGDLRERVEKLQDKKCVSDDIAAFVQHIQQEIGAPLPGIPTQ